MKHCDSCGVDFTGKLDQCPLCQTELKGEAVPSVFPRNKVKRSGMLALRLLAAATGISLLIMVLLWKLVPLPGNIVFTVCVAFVLNFLFVRNILKHSPHFLRVIVRYFLILLAIAVVWFVVTQDQLITTFVIPGICLIAVIVDAELIVIFGRTFISGYAKYLLFSIVLGLAPLLLVLLDITTWDGLAFFSAFAASIFALALAIFARKELIAEMRKLFSA